MGLKTEVFARSSIFIQKWNEKKNENKITI